MSDDDEVLFSIEKIQWLFDNLIKNSYDYKYLKIIDIEFVGENIPNSKLCVICHYKLETLNCIFSTPLYTKKYFDNDNQYTNISFVEEFLKKLYKELNSFERANCDEI